jgi:hypothetical protein
MATVTGTGAVAATVKIEVSNNGTTWLEHPDYTITLSGTTTDADGFTDADSWTYHRSNVTAISGTGATVVVTASA